MQKIVRDHEEQPEELQSLFKWRAASAHSCEEILSTGPSLWLSLVSEDFWQGHLYWVWELSNVVREARRPVARINIVQTDQFVIYLLWNVILSDQ